MTPSALMKQVKEALALGEKHDLAMLEIPGVCKFIRRQGPVPLRAPPSAEEQLRKEQLEAKKRARGAADRDERIKRDLDELELRGGIA